MYGDTRLPDRFWDKVQDVGGCWLWTASRCGDGYGHFWLDNTMKVSHRVVYEALVGPIPDGKEIDHLCRVRLCVNPEHLEAVTHQENSLRGNTVGAVNAIKTHCPAGHPYSGDNLVLEKQGRRQTVNRRCRICRSEQRKRWQDRARGASSVSNCLGDYRDLLPQS